MEPVQLVFLILLIAFAGIVLLGAFAFGFTFPVLILVLASLIAVGIVVGFTNETRELTVTVIPDFNQEILTDQALAFIEFSVPFQSPPSLSVNANVVSITKTGFTIQKDNVVTSNDFVKQDQSILLSTNWSNINGPYVNFVLYCISETPNPDLIDPLGGPDPVPGDETITALFAAKSDTSDVFSFNPANSLVYSDPDVNISRNPWQLIHAHSNINTFVDSVLMLDLISNSLFIWVTGADSNSALKIPWITIDLTGMRYLHLKVIYGFVHVPLFAMSADTPVAGTYTHSIYTSITPFTASVFAVSMDISDTIADYQPLVFCGTQMFIDEMNIIPVIYYLSILENVLRYVKGDDNEATSWTSPIDLSIDLTLGASHRVTFIDITTELSTTNIYYTAFLFDYGLSASIYFTRISEDLITTSPLTLVTSGISINNSSGNFLDNTPLRIQKLTNSVQIMTASYGVFPFSGSIYTSTDDGLTWSMTFAIPNPVYNFFYVIPTVNRPIVAQLLADAPSLTTTPDLSAITYTATGR